MSCELKFVTTPAPNGAPSRTLRVLAGWPAADAAPASLDETPFPGRGLVSTTNDELFRLGGCFKPPSREGGAPLGAGVVTNYVFTRLLNASCVCHAKQ